VIAVGDVHLGLLDTLPLCGEYSCLSSDFKGILLSLARRLGKITDRAVDFFTKKDKADGLTRDREAVEEKKLSKEEIFVITKGKTYVAGQTPKGKFPLLTLEKEDVFGCVPFMNIGHEAHSASVLASKNLKVEKLDTESLQNEYDGLSRTFRNLIDHMGTCVSATTEIACHLQ